MSVGAAPPAIPARVVPDAAPPTCDDVDSDAKRRFTAWSQSEHEEYPFRDPYAWRRAVADLDGDGVPEVEWDFSQPPMTLEAHLYHGGACPTAHLATLATGGLELDADTHGGHRDFRTEDYASFCEGNPCGCVPEIRHYVWNGREYAEDAKLRSAGSMNACDY